MKTREMTEAAMLSALFVVMSVIAITTGIGYSLYLDMVVPIIIGLIYLRCGFKYAVLSAITSLLIIILGLGDMISAIWMSQSVLLGFMCGIFIEKDTPGIDDIVYCSIFGCVLMIFIDIYFSALTGISFIKEAQGYAAYLANEFIKPQVIVYSLVACLPVGTVAVTYVGILVLGNKLKLLKQYGKRKFTIVKNFRKYGYYLCSSKSLIFVGLIYLIGLEILGLLNYTTDITYIVTVVMAVKYMFLYVIIKDAYSFIGKYIYVKTKSKKMLRIVMLGSLVMLVVSFRITSYAMILWSSYINLSLGMRAKQIKMLEDQILLG
ncbi:MAG: DUF2232 domain-containing protein [Clostridium sp.]|uniref:DUF2232 domain-containing protein n=1 Tax=Clostridium sp. TaxID=1506 RepID=UPI00305AC78E